MSHDKHQKTFRDEVELLRKSYNERRDGCTLYAPAGQQIDASLVEYSGPHAVQQIWYKDSGSGHRFVRLHDIPGTLSGDILRLRKNLPESPFHMDIRGDIITGIETPIPELPEEFPPDDEDCSPGLNLLPVVVVDHARHFTKRPKYNSEIYNYLKLQDNQLPSDDAQSVKNVIVLLGRSAANELVFPKMTTSLRKLHEIQHLSTYKRWILDLIHALRNIHSKGIVHKDLRPANFLFSPIPDAGTKRGDIGTNFELVLCDIESRWGNRSAPELDKTGDSDAGWTEKSDIYDIAGCIRGMVYANHPINEFVGAEWEVPAPLHTLCEACTVADPMKRPTLDELEALVASIETA